MTFTMASGDPFTTLLSQNKTYASTTLSKNPSLFETLSKGQHPKILWLGCSDSRIPETTVCNCQPGDVFVHRNIANIITPSDKSANSVIDYSVGVVGVEKIVVCGHTKCGGANAGLGDADLGENLNTWLEPLRSLRRKNQDQLDALGDVDQRMTRLAELNVRQSVEAVKANGTVQKMMKERGVTVHGVVFDIPKGELYVLDDA